jgi:flagellar hook protein FlgE
MALSGNGFFVVAQNNGSSDTPAFSSQSLYTRRGDFTENADGYLVNGAGYYLCGSTSGTSGSSPIKLPTTASAASGEQVPSSVSIGSDGTITGSYADGSTAALGQVAVAQVNGTDFMQSESGGAYSTTTSSGTATLGLNSSTITSGSVEASNTDISDQFSKMIMTQQAYSSNTKVLTSANEMLEDAINMMK